MRQQPKSLFEVIREVVLETIRSLTGHPWKPYPPKPCEFRVSKDKQSNNVQEKDRFDVTQEFCDKGNDTEGRAKEQLADWEKHDESWQEKQNARDLNRVGCLYIWVREDYEEAKKLFKKARDKAQGNEREMIEANFERVEEWLSRKKSFGL